MPTSLSRHLRTTHLLIGLATFVIFVLMGRYMKYSIHPLLEASDRLRFSLRGNHIYTLYSALLNLLTAAHLRIGVTKWRVSLQLIGSLLVILSTGLVIYAFFFESKQTTERPVTLAAVVIALAGTTLHLASTIGDQSIPALHQPEKARAHAGSIR